MSQRLFCHCELNSARQKLAGKPDDKLNKHNAKFAVLCFSLLSLNMLEQNQGAFLFPLASADNAAMIKAGNDSPALIQAEMYYGELGLNDSGLILIAQNATDSTTESAAKSEEIEVEEIPVEKVNEESDEDYLIPKTVYIGVDSIASPEVLPEIAEEPEPIDTEGALIDEQSTVSSENLETSESIVETETSESTASQESTDTKAMSVDEQSAASSEALEESKPIEQTSSNESDKVAQSAQVEQSSGETNSVADTKTDTMIKAPEIQQVKTESINSVSQRITLFKSIDVVSELDVPAGLPEDLNDNQDSRETASTVDSKITQENLSSDTQGKLSETEDQLAKIADQPEQSPEQEQDQDQVSPDETVADEVGQEGSAEDIKKPAVVVNINDSLQIDSRNEWGWTKIMSAAIEGNLERVNELLALGANPNIAGEDGRSPLMAASWNKHYEVVESLVNAGADVNLINRDGWTALSFASWNGDVVIVRSLLRFAANKFIKTADGFTPLQLAEQKGHQEIVELLK